MPQFREYDLRQGVFRQFVPERLLEEHHPALIVDLVVERLDLNSVYAVYGEEGNVAYLPKIMLKVLFYRYLCRLMTRDGRFQASGDRQSKDRSVLAFSQQR